MSIEIWKTLTILVGGIATLGIYSFLIKENKFYRFFEHLLIGIAAGYGSVQGVITFLWPKFLEPFFGLNIVEYPDGTMSGEYEYKYFFYLIPMAIGLLYYCIYSKRFGWLAKVAIGISLGLSAGLAFKGFFAEMMPQLVSSFKPLYVVNELGTVMRVETVNNVIFVIILLSVMYYFFFTFKRDSAASNGVARSGRMFMMVCFGSFFGSTVMARMALLAERLQFLIEEWCVEVVKLFA